MQILIFLAGMVFAFLIIDILKKTLILNSFKFSEKQLLLISMSLLQYKYHAIGVIEIVYDKAAEQDSQALKEKQEVINKIHEKFNSFGDQWISNVKKFLPYNTEYNSWKEAVEYADKLINDEEDDMQTGNKMDIRDKEKIIKSLLKNYLKIDNNLFISNKLFIANSGINWIYDNTKNAELIKHYLKDIDKYLKGEIDLYWSNGILTKKKVKINDNTKK